MSGIYGSWASRRDNIAELGTLTTLASTAPVEVSGTKFTFSHTIVGTNIKTLDEGSLDGTNWFALGDEKTHESTGTYGHSYSHKVVRYVRSRCTAIGNNQANESVNVWMACD